MRMSWLSSPLIGLDVSSPQRVQRWMIIQSPLRSTATEIGAIREPHSDGPPSARSRTCSECKQLGQWLRRPPPGAAEVTVSPQRTQVNVSVRTGRVLWVDTRGTPCRKKLGKGSKEAPCGPRERSEVTCHGRSDGTSRRARRGPGHKLPRFPGRTARGDSFVDIGERNQPRPGPATEFQRDLAWNPGRSPPGGNDSTGGPPGPSGPLTVGLCG